GLFLPGQRDRFQGNRRFRRVRRRISRQGAEQRPLGPASESLAAERKHGSGFRLADLPSASGATGREPVEGRRKSLITTPGYLASLNSCLRDEIIKRQTAQYGFTEKAANAWSQAGLRVRQQFLS